MGGPRKFPEAVRVDKGCRVTKVFGSSVLHRAVNLKYHFQSLVRPISRYDGSDLMEDLKVDAQKLIAYRFMREVFQNTFSQLKSPLSKTTRPRRQGPWRKRRRRQGKVRWKSR